MKLKKIMAGLLGAAMLLGTLGTAPTASAAESPTIDTTKKGSLTINKYEGNTGDTSKPLEGVEFTIYKVASIDQESAGGTTALKLTPVDASLGEITAETKYEGEFKTKVDQLINQQHTIQPAKPAAKTTLADGKASVKFDDLELGVYLVVETKAPAQVVTMSANFLVSVPMMNEAGTGWVYDIEASPKNQAVYGGIVLKKVGKTLNAKDGSTSEDALKGIQFKLEKKTTGDLWETVQNGGSELWTTGADGTIHVESLAPGDYRFVEAGREGDADDGFILDRKTDYQFTVGANGDVTTTDEDTKLTDDGGSPKKTFTITVENEKPQVDKEIQGKGKVDTVQVGDTVTWEISASIPTDIKELKTFKLKDQLSKGLTVKPQAEFTATVTADTETLETPGDYTITVGGYDESTGTLITIEFTEAGKVKMEGKKVVKVDFESTLNDKAVVGKEGNPNEVTLEYSNQFGPESVPGTPDTTTEEKPGEDPVVFTFALDIYKFYQQSGEHALQGAEFAVYTSESDAKTGSNAIATGTSEADGTVTFTSQKFLFENDKDLSIKQGEYWIVETKAPDGYNLLKEPIKVKFTVTYADKGAGRHQTVSDVTIEGGVATYDDATGHIKCEIENKKGFTLPETGGMGTMIFTVGGIALVAAGILLILATRRKKTAR